MSQYLLLKSVCVQNANALSSPFTFGFPAVTAFTGFAHALQRYLNPNSDPGKILVNGVGIVCHHFEMQDHQEGFSRALKLTANPLNKEGNRPSFVEEGRCHFTVSLLLEVENLPVGERPLKRLFDEVEQHVLGNMKLAGGDILGLDRHRPIQVLKDEPASRRYLMPGYLLMERREFLEKAMQHGQDALEALYGFIQIRHVSEQKAGGEVVWGASRAQPGWLVPIATGFHGVSKLSDGALQVRDTKYPHRFVESLVTLGEFVMPNRIEVLADCIWRNLHEDDIYACVQQEITVFES